MATTADEIRETAQAVCARLDTSTADTTLVCALSALDDDGLADAVRDAARLRAAADAVISVGAGIVAKRSERALGLSGLAQRRGHRTPTAMVQALTGSTRAEAGRQVRLGSAMGEADAVAGLSHESPCTIADRELDRECRSGDDDAPWFGAVAVAVEAHRLTAEAAGAILRGLGEADDRVRVEDLRSAALELIDEALTTNVDELAKHARWARDRLDPVGVDERTSARYAARSWRFNRNASGMRTAYIEFDDESGAFVDALVGAAMRPRRGGPRFIAADERARAQSLIDDPRSNDQLVFDLLMDTLRTGAHADPTVAFGSRQPGVRYVITQQQASHVVDDHTVGIGSFEDSGEAVAGSVIERAICDAGTRTVTVDPHGNPLDVGRDQRLFTARQRVALAIRDGGCRWPGCDRPPSYTEAHHIDHWYAHHGKTDTRDGVLLCRHHHMLLHDNHWRIRRENSDYWLVPPPQIDAAQSPIRMHSKSPLRPVENRQSSWHPLWDSINGLPR